MESNRSYRKITAKWRRILSSMLVLAMILSSVPTTGAVYAAELPAVTVVETTEATSEVAAEELVVGEGIGDVKAASLVSPEVNGNSVTFRYEGSGDNVFLAGSMNGWSTTATEMTKDDATGVFSVTINLKPGSYEYKFVVDGNWIGNDSGGNLILIVPGLEGASVSGVKGAEIDLPTLKLWTEGQNTASDVMPEYTLKTEGVESYVTIAGGKVTVSEGYEGDTIELTATANGMTATVTVELVSELYTYTIYARSSDSSHMSSDSAALHIWDEAAGAGGTDYPFAKELETLADNNTWLKAEVRLPFYQKLGIIFKGEGWAWQTSNLYYENTSKANPTLYIVKDDNKLYTSLDEIQSTPDPDPTPGEKLNSPEVNGNSVTFRYRNSSVPEGTDVYVKGSMNGWGDGYLMTKGDDGVYTCTINELQAGEYQYKFNYGEEWVTDPWNTNEQKDGNSVFTITQKLDTGVVSPEVVGNQVTFRYNKPATAVYLAGAMNGWDATATPMTKDEESGVFSVTVSLDAGCHEYKFVVDGDWQNDPSNSDKASNGNSIAIVPGLVGTSVSGMKGEEIELPTLKLWEEGKTTASDVTPVYTLKTEGAEEYVTLADGKITVSEDFAGKMLELTATVEALTATVTVNFVEKLYNYTIYTHSYVDSRMDVNESVLHVWDEAKETEAEAADFAFTEKVELDGKTWLKTVVSVPYSQRLGMIFRQKAADDTGAQWAWQNVYYSNTTQAEDVTLYIEDGQTAVYTDLKDVEYTPERYLLIEYTRDDAEYDNAVVYTWSGDWGTVHYKFEKPVNGKAIVKIPVLPSTIEKKINFIVKKDIPWDAEGGGSNKDGGDNFYNMPVDQDIVKIRFYNGEIIGALPYNTGSKMDKTEGKVNFFYRDDALFVDGNMESLKDKVELVVKSSTKNAEIDGKYAMAYDAENERFYHSVPLTENTDYYYYFVIDGVKTFDAFNDRIVKFEEEEYNILRNIIYEIDLTASVKNAEMDYNDNNVLYLDWAAKEGTSIEGFEPESITADLSQLGLGSKVELNKELKAFTFGCKDYIAPGEKTITVKVVDNCDNTYKTKVKVKVTERVKAEGTDSKLGDFDWDEAVIYFALTDRFFDGNDANNTATAGYDANDTTAEGRYHGGDFAGMTAKLDYLYDLGVNTIWLTPIVDNIDQDVMAEDHSDQNAEFYAYHGYWAEDFTKLNPHLGNEAELKALIDAAHAKGMKIMVDVVLNHAGYDTTETFNTILKDENGNYINMIRGAEETVPGDEKRDGLSGLPDFLTENEAVRNQLIEWQTSWMKEYDIDYYRVDTVKHVEDTTWEAFKNALTESNPEFKLIGEYYGGDYKNTADLLNSGKMDSLLDFGFKNYAHDLVNGKISAVENELAARNKAIDNTASLGGFMSSHDEDGMLYKLKKNTDDEALALGQMMVAASLQFTAKGQPVIYYGEEIGQSGANNWPYYDNRYVFDWNAVNEDNAIYNHYKKMLNIRRDYSEVFAKGTRTFVAGADADGYEVVRRTYNGENVFVGLNVKDAEKTATFKTTAKAGSTYTDKYSNKTYTVSEDGTLTVTIPGVKNGGTVVLVLTDGEEIPVVDTNEVTIKLHYYRADGEYGSKENADNWNVWMWMDGKGGAAYDLVNEGTAEKPDMVATYGKINGRATNKVGFIVRQGDWKAQEGGDRFIDISDVVSGTVHVYVNSGETAFTRVLGEDAILGVKVVSATYIRETNKVEVVTSQPILGSAETEFVIKRATGEVIEITEAEANDCVYTLSIAEDLTAMSEIVKNYSITYDNFEYNLAMPNVYSSEEFESQYTYTGNDLGATWTKSATTFKVWAPTAQKVQVVLYKSGDPTAEDEIKVVNMKSGAQGVWSAKVSGNLNGTYYTYRVTVNGKENEACDPYATTTGVNGKRAMVIDLDSTDPEGWATDKGPHAGMNYTDAVIYELHVRDASIDESSGVSAANKGKYLGLTETGTKTANGVPTALDHIKDLGVTHVHLLPVYDFGSVDETRLNEPQFNWGYDPVNYNVPEGSYSTDPYKGEVRVKEFKQMVKTMHDNNLNVVMDVVYNHVQDAEAYSFNQIVPKYFSRTTADGSYVGDTGCGNTTASERSMVQKYIVDSVLYWAKEYHIDGFRFDLVGLIDAETMGKVVEAVHAVDPDILFYGEGWSMSSGTTKGDIPMATMQQSKANLESGILSDFAYFSDTIRDNLAGSSMNLDGNGFVLGSANKESVMKQCFTAATDWCPGPAYTVNYASCHDNYTLFDKLQVQAEGATEEELVKMNNLSAAFYMLSQGIPFIHAGEEFLRTKVNADGSFNHNSYNSSDEVNKLRWSNLENEKYADVADYYKGLIEFRKNHEALRMTTPQEVAANVTSHTVGDSLVLFDVKGKDSVAEEVSDGIVVIFNANKEAKEVDLSAYNLTGDWNVCINAEQAGTETIKTVNGKVTVDAISALVLVKGETVDDVPRVPTDITAITNVHTVLSDVALPYGWTWCYPDTQIKALAGQSTKSFEAYYGDTIVEIPVNIVSISKVNVTTDSAVIEKGKTTTATANLVSVGANVPGHMVSVEWKTSNDKVAKVVKNVGSLTANVTAVTNGSATISAVVTIVDGNKTVTLPAAKATVKVTDSLATISFKDIPKEWTETVDNAYKTVYAENQIYKVSVASTSSKVTIKSSDAKIVKVGSVAKNAAGDFETTLTVKKAGYVKLTAIANDAAKTQTSIELYVSDATPNVSSTKVELNNKSTAAESIFVYANEDFAIESVSFDNDSFKATQVAGTNEYAVSLAKAVDKGNYKDLNLVIKVTGVADAYKVPFTVKVVSKDPTAKIKQTKKVNLYYNDAVANGALSVTSTEQIESVTLKDCGYEYDHATGQISVSKKEGADSTDKQGVLEIKFAGFAQAIEKNIKVATENKKPTVKLSAKSGVVYPNAGIEATEVTLQDVTTGMTVSGNEISVTFKDEAAKAAYDVATAANKVTFTLKDKNFTSKATATIDVKKANAVGDPVSLTYKLTVNAKEPTVALDQKTITLNKNSAVSAYERVVLNASVKDAPLGEVDTLTVEGANAKATAEYNKSIIATAEGNKLVVSLADVKELKNGSYKFNVTGKKTVEGKEVVYKATALTVKVVDVAPEKTIKLTKSGSIDVLNRDTTSIVYSPKLTNITGTITNVALTGRSSHLFKAELVDGKIKVSVKGNNVDAQNAVKLVTKYNYGIGFKLTLNNGTDVNTVVNTALQQFKLTQSKPKVTVVPKQTTMYNTVSNNTVSVAFNAVNKDGSSVSINKIELTNFNNAFAYDKETGTLSLTGRGEVVKGKTYSLKFNVYFDGYADNEKPVSVTYKVKVN